MPFVAPVTKLARTAATTADIPGLVDEALRVAATPPTGPAFLDFPLDQVFMEAEVADADAAVAPVDPLAAPAADAGALDRAAELLRGAERPVVMAGTGLYWARGEEALVRALRRAVGAGLPQRPGARLRARRPSDVLLARAGHRPQGRRRGAGDRRADGLPAGLRRLVRRGHADRRARLVGARAPAPARGGGRALRRRGGHARRAARRRGRRPRPQRLGRVAARDREREARRRAGRPDRRPRAAAPDARLRTSWARCSTATRW